MLRSLFSGISGLRAHQTALDVAGNNIANVNTAAFKGSTVRFQDTLSDAFGGATAPAANGGTNPAQIGLGVSITGVSVDFTQGGIQTTGRPTDLMLSGDGFFAVRRGGEVLYTRAGSFDWDAAGNLVATDGSLVMGYPAVGGVVNTAAGLQPVQMPVGATSQPRATTTATFAGNLPADAAAGTVRTIERQVYLPGGGTTTLSATFTRTATGWDVAATAGGANAAGAVTFDASTGALTAGGAMTIGGIAVDLAGMTGLSGADNAVVSAANGNAAGTLKSYSFGANGDLLGTFSNGLTEPLARVAVATFANPAGLEKVGESAYRVTANSGQARIGVAGNAGFGEIASGALEMSNVDLSQEFTNLIVAQRGFQANARVITTSDEVLQELTNLKR
jgi:flagellar hook protein FlgE